NMHQYGPTMFYWGYEVVNISPASGPYFTYKSENYMDRLVHLDWLKDVPTKDTFALTINKVTVVPATLPNSRAAVSWESSDDIAVHSHEIQTRVGNSSGWKAWASPGRWSRFNGPRLTTKVARGSPICSRVRARD